VRSWVTEWRGHSESDVPQDVIPSRLARRRARLGLGIVLGAWVGFDAVVGLLVRAHQIDVRCTGYSMGAGGIASFLVFPIFFGTSWRVRLVSSSGRRFVIARTVTGPRAVDLEALVRVRRFMVLGKNGSNWDELRIRDRYGVRLCLDRGNSEVDGAVLDAEDVRGLHISKAARRRLDTRYIAASEAGRAFLGIPILVGSMAGCCVASLFVTCLISGTPFNGG